jgi:hypothetical protein
MDAEHRIYITTNAGQTWEKGCRRWQKLSRFRCPCCAASYPSAATVRWMKPSTVNASWGPARRR